MNSKRFHFMFFFNVHSNQKNPNTSSIILTRHLATKQKRETSLDIYAEIQGQLSRNSIYHPNATVHVDILVSGREVNFHLCQRILLYSPVYFHTIIMNWGMVFGSRSKWKPKSGISVLNHSVKLITAVKDLEKTSRCETLSLDPHSFDVNYVREMINLTK